VRRPISIYCDWAMHDELGDSVPLTEELTMRALDALEHWQKAHAVSFDYYLLDCFWFEAPGDYRRFNPQAWPGGFGPALRRIEALGMRPGLWLDTTGGRVSGHGPWKASLNVHDNWSYCLFDGPYGQGLLDGMLHACGEWGVRVFKFDFANFFAVSPRYVHLDAGDAYARNVDAFRAILRQVRARYPDVVILAYNGFVYGRDYLDSTTQAVVPGIETHWLDLIDYLYSGDPRPADVPCVSLRRAIDMYQDHMVYKFRHSGIPLGRTDDHGCMVGTTNTIYYLGKRGWRRTWLQSLGRGGRKAHFYGDPTLLDDDDARFLGAGRALFFDLFEKGALTRPVGGVPCQSPWHGYQTGSAQDGLLVLVNGTAERQTLRLGASKVGRARVLFHDVGFEPECQVAANALWLTLAPEQMALVGLGEKAAEDCELGTNVGGDPVSADAQAVELPFEVGQGMARCSVPGGSLAGAADGFDALRLSFRLRRKGEAARRAAVREKPVCESLRIEVSADGRPIAPRRMVPDVKVWSGCSWVTGVYALSDLRATGEVAIRFTCPDAEATVLPEAWAQSL
jgi:hypothetical protein